MYCWLVVWNIFYCSIYWEWSSQLTNFFRGVETTNQWNSGDERSCWCQKAIRLEILRFLSKTFANSGSWEIWIYHDWSHKQFKLISSDNNGGWCTKTGSWPFNVWIFSKKWEKAESIWGRNPPMKLDTFESGWKVQDGWLCNGTRAFRWDMDKWW